MDGGGGERGGGGGHGGGGWGGGVGGGGWGGGLRVRCWRRFVSSKRAKVKNWKTPNVVCYGGSVVTTAGEEGTGNTLRIFPALLSDFPSSFVLRKI